MNVLITGAGLAGCHSARALAERGHQVMLFDVAPNVEYVRSVAGDLPVHQGDVRDLPDLAETMQREQVEVVIHTAYMIGDRLNQHPYSGLSVNIGGTIAVAEAARLTGVRRLVFAGTFGVFNWGLRPEAPVAEDFPVIGNAFYRASKIACEGILTSYAGKYGLQLAIVRFAQVYGIGHYAGGDLVGEALHQLVNAGLAGSPIEIDSQLFNSNDYIYAKDLAQGVALLCEKPLSNSVFNLGSGQLSQAGDVAGALQTAFPSADVRLVPGGERGYSPSRTQPLSIARIQQEVGYQPAYDVAAGIKDFVHDLSNRQTTNRLV